MNTNEPKKPKTLMDFLAGFLAGVIQQQTKPCEDPHCVSCRAREMYEKGVEVTSRTGDGHARSELQAALDMLPI